LANFQHKQNVVSDIGASTSTEPLVGTWIQTLVSPNDNPGLWWLSPCSTQLHGFTKSNVCNCLHCQS